MDLGLSGRRALVMGASRGLGRAIAEALGAEGVKLAICAREGARLYDTARALGAQALPCDYPLTTPEHIWCVSPASALAGSTS